MRIGVIHPGSMGAAVAMAARAGGAMVRGLAITTTVCAALGGCAQNPTTEPPRVSLSESLAPVPDPIDDQVGFAVREGGTWRPGDGVLYEITIEAGDERRRSFMRVETLREHRVRGRTDRPSSKAPSHSHSAWVRPSCARTTSTRPRRDSSSTTSTARTSDNIVGVYTACLRQGYHATATAMRAHEEDPDTPRDPEAFAGIAWIYLLGAGIQDESVARTYLKGLANMPPLYSYLLNMGLKVSIDWRARRSTASGPRTTARSRSRACTSR